MSKFIANNLRDLSQHENVILNIVVESNNIVAVQLLLEDKAVCSTEIKNLFPALRIALSEGFLACAKIMISKFMEMIGRLGTDEFRILLTLKMSLEIKERAQLEAVVGRHARASTRSIDASSPGHPLTSMKSHISRSPRNSSKSVDLAVLNEEITQPQLLAQIPDASEPESKPEPHSRRKRFFCLCI